MNIESIIKENPMIIDVRTSEEFAGGHVKGSVNIPLQEVHEHIERLSHMDRPIVLCCASGVRSAMATQMLIREGIVCYNGGSWLNINHYQSRTV